MPRHPRLSSPLDIYHVVVRGINQQVIFIDSEDYHKYLNILALYVTYFHAVIYAFCLMSNHVHILVYVPNGQLSQLFHRINATYAQWFNTKYGRSGPLQESRFFSVPVLSEGQLLKTIRYIHQNPMKANLEPSPGSRYYWSSMPDYLNGCSNLVDIQTVLTMMNGPGNFIRFHEEVIDDSNLEPPVITCRISDHNAVDIMEKVSTCRTPAEFQRLPYDKQKEMIPLLNEKGISIRQLNRLTGIPRKTIEKMIHIP